MTIPKYVTLMFFKQPMMVVFAGLAALDGAVAKSLSRPCLVRPSTWKWRDNHRRVWLVFAAV